MISLDALEALARKATSDYPLPKHIHRVEHTGYLNGRPVSSNTTPISIAMGAFIAACDPQTILELVKLARRGEQS